MNVSSTTGPLHRSNSSPLVQAFEEIAGRLLADPLADPDALLAEYPDYAEALRQLLPTMAALADLGIATITAGHQAPSFPQPVANSQQPHSAFRIPHPAFATLGDFQILREIGRGGMGIVYEAEQLTLRRRVALKILPFAGMLDARQLGRFQNEARAAATLEHANIVPVYAVGEDRGVHYYAMRLIRGQSLAELIAALRGSVVSSQSSVAKKRTATDNGQLTTDQPATDHGQLTTDDSSSGQQPTANSQQPPDTAALAALTTEYSTSPKRYFRRVAEIGVQIAEALQHAHSHGILHRDVKPANILLDSEGKAWITDFGLARLDADTSMTASGALLGTLRYMSPEQVEGKSAFVDHRTDVYSLGLTMYEFLALRPAFEESDRHALIRNIEHKEPRPLLAVNRGVPGDLAKIICKSIDKDPQDRYSSAGELAADLRRFLNHHPVQARRASLAARATKWARRNRALVVGTAALFLALFAGLCGTTWQAYRATRAEELAERRLDREQQARLQADRQRLRAAQEAERATEEARRAHDEAAIVSAISAFLQEDLLVHVDIAEQIDSDFSPDPNIPLRVLLDRASSQVEGRFASHPIVEGSLHYTIGRAYTTLGQPEPAERHLLRAVDIGRNVVGIDHPGTSRAIAALGVLKLRQGKLAEAEPLLDEAWQNARRLTGKDSDDALDAQAAMIVLRFEQGRHEEAKELAIEALSLCQQRFGDEHPSTLSASHNLAAQYGSLGQHEMALSLHRRVLEVRERTLGRDHPDRLNSLRSVAVACDAKGNFVEAQRLFEELVERCSSVLGPDHEETLAAEANLGWVLHQQGKNDKAERMLTEALQRANRLFGPHHPATDRAERVLILVFADQRDSLVAQDKLAEATGVQKKLYELYCATSGEASSSAMIAQVTLANRYLAQGDCATAEATFRDYLEKARQHPARVPSLRQASERTLGVCLQLGGRAAEAEEYLLSLVERESSAPGGSSTEVLQIQLALAQVFSLQGRHKDSEAMARTVLDASQTVHGREDFTAQLARHAVAASLVAQRRFDEAEPLLREAIQELSANHPQSWLTYSTMSLLGECQFTKGLNAEAEEHLLAGAEGLRKHLNSAARSYQERQQLRTRCIDRLIQLYEAQQRPDDVARWTAEREKWRADFPPTINESSAASPDAVPGS